MDKRPPRVSMRDFYINFSFVKVSFNVDSDSKRANDSFFVKKKRFLANLFLFFVLQKNCQCQLGYEATSATIIILLQLWNIQYKTLRGAVVGCSGKL
jgi:hypothetical protein